jgi:hypothetical protein
MHAILKFNLDNVDDLYSHKQALKGRDLALVLWDICEYIRAELRYGGANEEHYARHLQDKIFEKMRLRDIDLDDLIYSEE